MIQLFQVQNMYSRHNHIKPPPQSHDPTPSDRKTNANNNNNKNEGVGVKKQQTKIFVWNSPENDPKNPQQIIGSLNTKNQHSGPKASNNSTIQNPSSYSTNTEQLQKPLPQLPTSSIIDTTSKETAAGPPAVPPHKFRSITPTPDPPATSSVSQLRRAKTPTPAMNKDLLRNRQTLAQRRGSDLKLRPRSAYGAAPIETNLSPAPNSYYPPSAWSTPTLMNHSLTPPPMPKEYYEQFYKWLQYYAALSPDQQRSLLSYPPNKTPTMVSSWKMCAMLLAINNWRESERFQ